MKTARSKYKFHELEVNQSHFFNEDDYDPSIIRQSAYYHGIRQGKKFSTKSTKDGVYVNRIK